MNIASTTFLFLFLPVVIGLYFLLPCRKGMGLRNLYLLAVSLFFYAWGEPVYVFLLLLLILMVWLLGKMADVGYGRAGEERAVGGRACGKLAVALTVVVCVGVLLCFKYLSTLFSDAGLLLGKDLSFLPMTLPVGMAFFCFHAISYVVDIYRGQCHSPKRIFSTALYLSVFYKMMQGPIVTYREFEPQIEQRSSSWNDVAEGLWRFAIGLGKKMIIATNLQSLVKMVFILEPAMLTTTDAWIGCAVFMVFLYFDFSGYSDMAIGLGRVFGFKTPENFNYPYLSTSIAEYWRRWHITLIAWFRDYLYYPIILGPSVRFRKCLLRHNISTGMAKTLQNIFVPACVWTVTALWHGTNWNYTLWGLANCALIVVEPYIRPLRNKRLDNAIRWFGTMLLLLLMVPLICIEDLSGACHYFRVMFGGGSGFAVSPLMLSSLRMCWAFLVIGIIGCFPVVPFVKRWKSRDGFCVVARNVCVAILMMVILIYALAFLYRSGMVWFMYQQ